MAVDKTKQTKYAVPLPYPEPKIEEKNIKYTNILLKDYAGSVSEFTAISLYIYQNFVSYEQYQNFGTLVEGIAKVEMKHLELLGETIKLEGVKPVYIDNVRPPGKFWSPTYVDYETNYKKMLKIDIKAEQDAIKNYKYQLTVIDDKYIKKLIERIILDEELHLKLFIQEYEKYNLSNI